MSDGERILAAKIVVSRQVVEAELDGVVLQTSKQKKATDDAEVVEVKRYSGEMTSEV